MERGTIGEFIPLAGESGKLTWRSEADQTNVYAPSNPGFRELIATFYGEQKIRMERVALFITAEQS